MKTLVLLSMALVALFTATRAAETQQPDPRFQIPATDDGLPGAGPIRRYDWFRNLWSQRRSAWAERVQQDQGALVFLGDSITQGWGDDMNGSFPGVKVANKSPSHRPHRFAT